MSIQDETNIERVGLAVMRLQPIHKGHTFLIQRMLEDCERVVVAIGSADKKKDFHNPFSIEQRTQMVRNIFGKRVKIVPLEDLGTTERSDDWCNYVEDKICKVGIPEPTDYYSGSEADVGFYKFNFWDGKMDINENKHYTSKGVLKRIHIVDRMSNNIPSATDLRKAIVSKNDDFWMQYIPRVNWYPVKRDFPPSYMFV